MTEPAKPLSFGHHAHAVLGAAVMGSTIVSLVMSVTMFVVVERFPGFVWLGTMAVLIWLAMFIIALPGAGIALSLVWPVTRRRTVAANWISVLACATMAILVAPLGSPEGHGITLRHMSVFALTGALLALCYLAVAGRFGRETPIPSETAVPAA